MPRAGAKHARARHRSRRVHWLARGRSSRRERARYLCSDAQPPDARAATRRARKTSPSRTRPEETWLCSRSSAGDPAGIDIHLAWCTPPGECWTTPENVEYVEASLQLARDLGDTGCHRLVVAGSCTEYDWDYGFLSEECTPLRPRTLYGACKNGLREILQSYCARKTMQFA